LGTFQELVKLDMSKCPVAEEPTFSSYIFSILPNLKALNEKDKDGESYYSDGSLDVEDLDEKDDFIEDDANEAEQAEDDFEEDESNSEAPETHSINSEEDKEFPESDKCEGSKDEEFNNNIAKIKKGKTDKINNGNSNQKEKADVEDEDKPIKKRRME